MHKEARDEFFRATGISEIDFLPERPYSINGFKALHRKGTDDFYVLSIPREKEIQPHLTMQKDETFVDVGANVGYYSLRIAKEYSSKRVNVIAIEAHPENCKALRKNIELNDFKCIKPINIAVSDNKSTLTLYERIDGRNRIRSEFYSLSDAPLTENNVVRPGGRSLQVECDTLDNILGGQKVDVMKIDIEGGEVSALRGGTNTLKMLRKIIVEIHGNTREKIRSILNDTHRFKLDTVETPVMGYVIGSKIA